ncbi:uncharacterized protein LY89DRAFT_734624 [Mollisia scopiformis]|uniref:BTB domain-containing protein n=1 Tax=Mollisia scopiformis TaxID=149040 RepID=A0A194X8M2_MOLSC|nr:uncharacterized protein LY89DRAFT_734624 [Mollisia scopiformis]KUJ16523.1 hypothetical protein LY89DRAFT_734624 [Mollisia scopiformis]
MTGQKRRAVDSVELAEQAKLKIKVRLEIRKKQEVHRSISARVIIGSPQVEIWVGEKQQAFIVHQHLLTLHSGYFNRRFSIDEEDEKIQLPEVQPKRFTDFVSWMYYGTLLDTDVTESETAGEDNWALGSFLEAPSFQNHCMDDCFRHACRDERRHFVYVTSIESVYKATEKASVARKFTTDLMNCLNPLKKLKEGSEKWNDWTAMLERCPDLKADMENAVRQDWNGTYPWDCQYRDSYMVEEFNLGERWEEQILARRSLEQITMDAATGEMKSVLQLSHLKRKK